MSCSCKYERKVFSEKLAYDIHYAILSENAYQFRRSTIGSPSSR